VYPVDGGAGGITNLRADFTASGGISFWVNGEFAFGALSPGGAAYSGLDLGSLPPGPNVIQVLRESHNDNAGMDVQITGNVRVPVAQTATGSNVPVSFDNGASVTFSSVASAGTTTLTPSAFPPASQGAFVVNGAYYDISTTVNFAGAITVTLPYDPRIVTDPFLLRLYHLDPTVGD